MSFLESENSYGRIAFEAYWKELEVEIMWEDQEQTVRTAWEKAALAVVQSFYDSTKPS